MNRTRTIIAILVLVTALATGAEAEAMSARIGPICRAVHGARYCQAREQRHAIRVLRRHSRLEAKRAGVSYRRFPVTSWEPYPLWRLQRWERRRLRALSALPTPYCRGQGGNRLTGCLILWHRGASFQDWLDVDYIYTHESDWQTHDPNSLGCDQIPQACPGSKTGCGADDASCQVKWGIGYMIGRYGSISGAARFWRANAWY